MGDSPYTIIQGGKAQQLHGPDAKPHIEIMPDTPSRDEVNAKLEAAEARSETRFAQLMGALDQRAAASDRKFDALDTKIGRLAEDVQSLVTSVGDTAREIKADNKSTISAVRVTGIGAVLAVFALIIALWVAGLNVQNNMLTAFQSGLGVRTLPQVSAPSKP